MSKSGVFYLFLIDPSSGGVGGKFPDDVDCK